MDAAAVLEIVPLPEITKLEEAPSFVAGIVHFHGRIVPIVDLLLRFGYPMQAYELDDCIVFLEREGRTIGVIANEAQVVLDFDDEQFAPVSGFGVLGGDSVLGSQSPFVCGVAVWGTKLVMRLDVRSVLDLTRDIGERTVDELAVRHSAVQFAGGFAPEMKAILRERTLKLAQHADIEESMGVAPVAVVRIENEFFGFALDPIREFAELHNVTPIPCCPEFVIGQINLRGDLITVVDIGGPLGLRTSRVGVNRKVVVLNDPQLIVGVIVDELLGVFYPGSQVQASIVGGVGSLGQDYRRGFMADDNRTVSLIDLPKLMSHGSLAVNEKP